MCKCKLTAFKGTLNIPGEGGEEPLELALFAGVNISDASAPKLPDDGGLVKYIFVRTCGCCSLKFSNLRGDGMNPTSHPSFTRRPIHQLLSYFSYEEQK